MHPLKPGESNCPVCGQEYGRIDAEAFALRPGTILEGKYLVGEMLGQGGFGITYIGFDLLLEQKVAIKEYFPMSTGMVSRENCSTVLWSSTMMQKSGVEKGFDSFLKEARKMAKLGDIPGVVGVKSVFIQNETAYIVMDYVEGETLLKRLQREGPMEFHTCVALLKPIMQALALVHELGIIHRDISPDNIMMRKDGKLVLLDLGAAKDLELQREDGTVQSSQLVAKHGFSPFEQYGKTGQIGPRTDVYAMAATIYYCCTGKLPPSAVDRVEEDTLTCQPRLTQEQFNILSLCMAVKQRNRPRDMQALMENLEKTSAVPAPKLPKWLLPAAAAVLLVVLLLPALRPKKEAPAVYVPTEEEIVTQRIEQTEQGQEDRIEQMVTVCSHDWQDATCTEAEVCRQCGEIRGQPTGHSWTAAAWNAPKTCQQCGQTEGSADISVRDVVTFGQYEQDNDVSGKEPIEWIVLEEDGKKALLISRYCLDNIAYNGKGGNNKWETSALRSWLNGTFLLAAFSNQEQDAVIASTVTTAGSSTTDSVFLLSVEEVERYFSSDLDRTAHATAYAVSRGAQSYSSGAWWRLRSPGKYNTSVTAVYASGKISYDGDLVSDQGCAVRPAFWVDITGG